MCMSQGLQHPADDNSDGAQSHERLFAPGCLCAGPAKSEAASMPCVQALFTTYGFHFPVTVALLQMLFIAPVCYLVARPPLEVGLAKGALPLATVNVLNVVCGLIGGQHPNAA